MPDAPTPLDLDAIRAMLGDRPALGRSAALDLIHEVERLRARVSDEPGECVMTHTPPFDFAQCETHDETFPLGGACRFHGRTSVAEVYADEADQMRARAEKAEAEVARLTARPAPAWDEEAVQAEVLGIDARHHFHGTACLCGFDSHGRARSATEHITSAVLAVVREHLPVKPSREAVIEAMLGSDIITDDLRAEASAQGTTQREPLLCFADAVLDLWPGESRATVQAEALRDAADEAEAVDADALVAGCAAPVSGERGRQSVIDAARALCEEPWTWLRARAARLLAAEGGADRG